MAIAELLDEEVEPVWASQQPNEWDLLTIRRMLQRMLQLKRDGAQLDGLRKRIAEQYTEQVTRFDDEYQGLRAQVADWITRFNGKEPVRLPDIGTAYLQGKDAKPKMHLVSQEAAVTWVQQLPATQRDDYYTKAFSPQAYLLAHQAAVEAALQGAAVDDDGRARLTEDGTGVVQTTGEIVSLPPGVALKVADPVLALRPA